MEHDTARPRPKRSGNESTAGSHFADPRWASLSPGDPVADDDLSCPACGVDLGGSERFATFRVCPRCHRHFPMPARERLRLLVDPDSFVETNAALVSVDPLVFRDLLPLPDRLAEARERAGATGPGGGLGAAVVTGIGAIGGREAVLVVLDHAYLGGSIGLVAGEKVVLAMELAAARRLPLIALCAAGGARTEAGMLSLVQLAKTAAAATRLHRSGVPFVSLLAHPTTGGVYAGLANQADLILAEPGAQIGFGAGLTRGPAVDPGAETNTAELLLTRGLVDAVVDRARLRNTLASLLGLFADRGAFRPAAQPPPLITAGHPSAWQAAGFARHPDRPTALDYVRRLIADFIELHGDRIAADDPAVVAGLGRLGGVPVAVVAQERGRGDDAARRNGGRAGPAGYRKAVRLMRLAGHLELPIVTLVDTPGAASGAEAEAGGIGLAVAQALGLMSILPVPIVSVVVGEGGGAGALALGVGDRILMQEHAVYSVTGPDAAAPVPYPGAEPDETGERSTASSKLTAGECRRLGIVDVVVPEPAPAAHADPEAAARLLGAALSHAHSELSGIGPRRLLDERARKVRGLGQTTPEGRELARREVRELQELQRTLARSWGDLRERWEERQRSRPRFHLPRPGRALHRPDLADLAGRLAARHGAGGARSRGRSDREADGDAGS